MLSGNYRVVQQVFVVIQSGVLKVELDQLDAVSKGVQWHLFTFHDRDKILGFNFTSMGLVNSNWLQVTLQNIVVFQLAHTDSTGLSVEEMSRVEHSLSFVAGHHGEKECIFRLTYHAQRHV
jgi:hypothetical protein